MAPKWIITAIIGAVVLVSIGYTGTLYISDFRNIWNGVVSANPDLKYAVASQLFESKNDKIHVLTANENSTNSFSRTTITKDEIIIYEDGRLISGKFFPKIEYFRTYGEDKWVQLFRKPTKTILEVEERENDVLVRRTTEYYATGHAGSLSGTGGKLIETFKLPYDAESSMKFDVEFIANENSPNRKNNLHRLSYDIRYTKGLTEVWNNHTIIFGNLQVSWFNEEDKIESFNGTNIVFKPQKGDVRIDPIIRIGPVAIEYYRLNSYEGKETDLGSGRAWLLLNITANVNYNKTFSYDLVNATDGKVNRIVFWKHEYANETVELNRTDIEDCNPFTYPNGTFNKNCTLDTLITYGSAKVSRWNQVGNFEGQKDVPSIYAIQIDKAPKIGQFNVDVRPKFGSFTITSEAWVNSSYNNGVNFTVNVPSTSIVSIINDVTVTIPINWDTKAQVDEGQMFANGTNMIIYNQNGSILNWMFAEYDNPTYGMNQRNTSFFIKHHMKIDNSSNISILFNCGTCRGFMNSSINDTFSLKSSINLLSLVYGGTNGTYIKDREEGSGGYNEWTLSSGANIENQTGLKMTAINVTHGQTTRFTSNSGIDGGISAYWWFRISEALPTGGAVIIGTSTEKYVIREYQSPDPAQWSSDGGQCQAGATIATSTWYFGAAHENAAMGINMTVFGDTSHRGRCTAAGTNTHSGNGRLFDRFPTTGLPFSGRLQILAIYTGADNAAGVLTSDEMNATWAVWSNHSASLIVNDTEFSNPISFTIYQDGQPISRKFEYQRANINITVIPNANSDFCIDLNAKGFENATCFTSTTRGEINYTVKEYRAFNFSDGTRSKNFTSYPINATLNLTRYRNITEAWINLTGYNNPYDLSLDIGAEGVIDAVLPGYINSSRYLVQDVFTNNLTSEQIFFGTSGSTTRYLNYSTLGLNFSDSNLTGHKYMNITMMLYGNDAGSVNLNFSENFTSNDYINNTGTNSSLGGERYGAFVYEDFSQRPQNQTNRWIRYDYSSATSWTFAQGTGGASYSNRTTLVATHQGGGAGTENQRFRTMDMDMKDFYSITMNVTTAQTGHPGGTGTMYAGLRNDNSSTHSNLVSRSVTPVNTFNNIIVFNRTDNTVRGYLNGVLQDSMTLNTADNYSLFWYGTVSSTAPFGGTSTQTIEISSINMSGARGNYTIGQSYKNSTIRSSQVVNATNLVTVVRLDAISIIPAGQSINWYLSNDNASTWESATLGGIHLFSSTGRTVSWRADIFVNESGNETTFGFPRHSPVIKRVLISGISGNASNVTMDVGNDGTNEFTFSGYLNSSVSPRNISLSNESVANYIFNNCASVKTCLVPIKISTDSAGILNYTTLSASTSTTNLNLLLFNRTRVDDVIQGSNQTNMTLRTGRNGTVEIRNFTYDYPDDQNYTIKVYATGDYSGTNSTTLISRFSRFIEKVLDPFGWAIFPTSANQTEVPAEFQNTSHGVFNLTGNASFDDFTIFFKQNEIIDSSMNITFSNTSNATRGTNISMIYQPIAFNISRNWGMGVWTWGYFNNSSSGVYLPNISFNSICKDCIR